MTESTCSRMRLMATAFALLLTLAMALASPRAAWGATPKTKRVSVSSTGTEGNGNGYDPAISADGRFVAFVENASNLIRADTNGVPDIFVRDRHARTTRRVSVSSTGTEGNGNSFSPSISADGRFVAFSSAASNLIRADTNGRSDIFVRDRQTGTTRRVSVSSTGTEGNGNSSFPAISADGRFVAFSSAASNLIDADTNGRSDIFVRDRQTGTTRRVSVSSSGRQADGSSDDVVISSDGRLVAFVSLASNLVAGDTKGISDVFAFDLLTGTTSRVSVSSTGAEGNGRSFSPSISADGRFVAYSSGASNLVGGDTNGSYDVFVRDRQAARTRRVSVTAEGAEGNGDSYAPSISADGRFVAYSSGASNLVGGDTNGSYDVFVRDRQAATIARVSVSSGGEQGDGVSISPSISADGGLVALSAAASNLVPSDTNGHYDVFVRGPLR